MVASAPGQQHLASCDALPPLSVRQDKRTAGVIDWQDQKCCWIVEGISSYVGEGRLKSESILNREGSLLCHQSRLKDGSKFACCLELWLRSEETSNWSLLPGWSWASPPCQVATPRPIYSDLPFFSTTRRGCEDDPDSCKYALVSLPRTELSRSRGPVTDTKEGLSFLS